MDSQPATDATPRTTGAVRPVDLRDYVAFDDDGPTRVRVFATDVLTVDLWCLEPRRSTQVLAYDDADTVYTVVGGTGWFVTDEGEIGLDPLGAILIPAGTAHGIDNRSADPLIVQATASPPDAPLDELTEDAPGTPEQAAVHRTSGSRAGEAWRRLLSGRRG